jgi:Abortive infection C-terminus
MMDEISPKYLMKLSKSVEKAIIEEYPTDKAARFYIERWHKSDDYNNNWENFRIIYGDFDRVDIMATLNKMDGETLLKIAIDMGVETPDFIPSIPQFKNDLKENFKSAYDAFQRATKHIEAHPDMAIGLANSTLESIIKEIMKDERILTHYDKNMTLYNLTTAILKEFKLYPNSDLPEEIKTIGSSLIRINQGIEKLRSEKTRLHGKMENEYIVNDPVYAYFIVNAVATVGLFLYSFYKTKLPIISKAQTLSIEDDLPF